MAQIKNDMRGQKRVFSGDTESSYTTNLVDDKFYSFPSNVQDPISVHVPPYSPDEKENQRDTTHRRTSSVKSTKSNASSKPRPSPRKSRRNPIDPENLAEDVSRLSVQDRRSFSDGSLHSSRSQPSATRRSQPPRVVSLSHAPHPNALSTHLAPAYPSSSLRNDDLNRFVSSSTASGTTLTSGSAPSFVKHAGPAHIRTIAPTDLPPLPERLGNMLFDKVMMKWVKSTAQATQDVGELVPPDELSEDPFGDIESLRDDSRTREPEYEVSSGHLHPTEMSRIEEQSEVDDEEEMELTSFSTDDPSALVVDVMTGVETFEDDASTDSEDHDAATISGELAYDEHDFGGQSMSIINPPLDLDPPAPPPADPMMTPHRTNSLPPSATPVIRSAMKTHATTPSSALKDPIRTKFQTPLYKGHRRSVSFSDGKREGPIQGLGESTTTDDQESGTDFLASREEHDASTSGVVQSARSKRIALMMNALEDDGPCTKITYMRLASQLFFCAETHESPVKGGSSHGPDMQTLSARRPSGAGPGDTSRRAFSRSRTGRRLSFTADKTSPNLNATFLTECSFAVSHDRLVEVITDVQPFTPHWDELASIDLAGKKLESVARLKEFLPRLGTLSLYVTCSNCIADGAG